MGSAGRSRRCGESAGGHHPARVHVGGASRPRRLHPHVGGGGLRVGGGGGRHPFDCCSHHHDLPASAPSKTRRCLTVGGCRGSRRAPQPGFWGAAAGPGLRVRGRRCDRAHRCRRRGHVAALRGSRGAVDRAAAWAGPAHRGDRPSCCNRPWRDLDCGRPWTRGGGAACGICRG